MPVTATDTAALRLNKSRVKHGFDRIAEYYDQAAVLQREVGLHMLERLDLVKLKPSLILDVGCGTGTALPALLSRYRQSQVLAIDLATNMLSRASRQRHWFKRPLVLCADAESLPLAANSCQLIFANVVLPWCDIDTVLAEFHRVLAPEGLLLFSTLGPDTLIELRQDWRQLDHYEHINAFFDMHDIGDALLRMGFDDPVMDTERFTLTYRHFDDLLHDVRHTGGGNATAGRARGLMGRGRRAMLERLYESRRRDNILPATVEVVHGHAWGTAHARSRSVGDVAVVPISAIGRK